jgi:hypothetical protein
MRMPYFYITTDTRLHPVGYFAANLEEAVLRACRLHGGLPEDWHEA